MTAIASLRPGKHLPGNHDRKANIGKHRQLIEPGCGWGKQVRMHDDSVL